MQALIFRCCQAVLCTDDTPGFLLSRLDLNTRHACSSSEPCTETWVTVIDARIARCLPGCVILFGLTMSQLRLGCDYVLRLGCDHALRHGSCCRCGLRVCVAWLAMTKAHVQKRCAWGSRRVQGLDATAARTFFSLRSGLERLGVELVLTHMPSTRYACTHTPIYTYTCMLMLMLSPPTLALCSHDLMLFPSTPWQHSMPALLCIGQLQQQLPDMVQTAL